MMQNSSKRPNGRLNDQVRPLKIFYNSFGYATSSVLFEVGDTKVLCSVSMQQGVPSFLKGSGGGMQDYYERCDEILKTVKIFP